MGCDGGCFVANVHKWNEHNWTQKLFAITYETGKIPPGRLRGHIHSSALKVIASRDKSMVALDDTGIEQYDSPSPSALKMMESLPLNLGVPNSDCFVSQVTVQSAQHVSLIIGVVLYLVCSVSSLLVGVVVTFLYFLRRSLKGYNFLSANNDEEPE